MSILQNDIWNENIKEMQEEINADFWMKKISSQLDKIDAQIKDINNKLESQSRPNEFNYWGR